jgi:hypothetical protein
MRIFELDDEARENWVQATNLDVNGSAGTGAITKVAPGAAGAPANPAGVTWANLVKHAAGSGSSNKTLELLRILQSSEIRLEFWAYIDSFGNWTAGGTNIMFLRAYSYSEAGAPSPRIALYARGTADQGTYSYRAYCGPSASQITVDLKSAASGYNDAYVVNNNAPGWYKHVVSWKASSTDVAADGDFTWFVYAAADIEHAVAGGSAHTSATGAVPLASIGREIITGLSTVPAVYYGDLTVHDAFAGEGGPGILLPMLHDPRAGAVSLRLVCDRDCDVAVTYGTLGTEHIAAETTLQDGDDGRIHEFELTGLEPETAYKWVAVLDDGVSEPVTVSSLDGTATGFQFTMPPAAGAASAVPTIMLSDTHRQNYLYQATRNTQSVNRLRGTKPPVVILGGDILTNLGYTGTTYDRAGARLLNANTFDMLRRFTGKRVCLWLDGNHEYFDLDEEVQGYVHAVSPHRAYNRPRHTKWSLGPADFFYLDVCGMETGATGAQAGIDAIEDWLTPALAASTATHKVVLLHGYGLDVPTKAGLSNDVPQVRGLTTSGALNPTATLHAALKARADLGERVYCLHGHNHGGSWWVKDKVAYIGAPVFQTIVPKAKDYGNFTLPAGELDTMAVSIQGYGSEEGSQGWLYSLWAPSYSRHQIFDAKTTAGVYAMSKRFEQWRMVR